jgi:outer membrane protein TolC
VAILEKELKLGEVKRIDLLKGEIELANARIALSEAVLQLIQGEGGWEKLLGLQAGGLARLAAPNGDRK